MGVMGRLARELEEINPRATPETSRPEPEQKAAELLTAYTEEVDAFTGARQLHTGTLVKRLLHLALTELINATECRDPATAIYYEAVQRCILTKTIK
jgi:hypothetical protein